MARLGKCLDLTVLSPIIVMAAGATATWLATSATAGTFVVHLPATPSCGGPAAPGFADRYASCTFTFAGCGSVRVSMAGTGSDDRYEPTADAGVLAGDGSYASAIQINGTNGGATCHSVALAPRGGGSSTADFTVGCGAQMQLSFDVSIAVSAPACTCTFTITVL